MRIKDIIVSETWKMINKRKSSTDYQDMCKLLMKSDEYEQAVYDNVRLQTKLKGNTK
jgi:hypothetical protein